MPRGATAEEVCFGPEGRCGALVVHEIGGARRDVHVQAYSFTARDIAAALVRARRRGVGVRVVVDATQAREAVALLGTLLDVGVKLRLDGAHRTFVRQKPMGLAHNKIIVIDDAEVLTGSFNFSTAAERYNAENLLILRGDRPLAKAYLANWDAHWAHSTPATVALLAPKRD